MPFACVDLRLVSGGRQGSVEGHFDGGEAPDQVWGAVVVFVRSVWALAGCVAGNRLMFS